MPQKYESIAIPEEQVPQTDDATFQHVLDTYVSETNKIISTWRAFADADLRFQPDAKSRPVIDVVKHQLLSERRFFGEFMGTPEPAAEDVLPTTETIQEFCHRQKQLALRRLPFLAAQPAAWWLQQRPFFEVQRERIWIFWRRVLHAAHHRTQLTTYLRVLDYPVPPTYGPTADVKWKGADPTDTVEAARRRSS